MFRRALLLALVGWAAVPAVAAGVPRCRPAPEARVVLSGRGPIESLLVDERGRLLYTDRAAKALMWVDHPGARPQRLARGIADAGGLALDRRGRIYVGFGNNSDNGLASERGGAGIYRVDPRTGRKGVWARGLSMANGLVRRAGGTVFASDDFAASVDRISPGGRVARGSLEVRFANGLALGRSERYLYANQSFSPSRVVRVDLRRPPFRVTVYAAPPAADAGALLDGLAVDRRGTLFAAAFSAGEVWRIDTRRRICALASGLVNPTSVAVGRGRRGFARGNLYAAGYGGSVVVLRGVAAPCLKARDRPPCAAAGA